MGLKPTLILRSPGTGRVVSVDQHADGFGAAVHIRVAALAPGSFNVSVVSAKNLWIC